MVHLLTDTGKQAQVHQMALVIGSAVGLPFLESVISLALQAAWSFGESVLDIRCLLGGGKIPLVKDAGSWQLSSGKSQQNSGTAESGAGYRG